MGGQPARARVDRRLDRHAGTQHPGRARHRRRSTILTGMRCTILVKLPVALSGGSSANCWPLAGAMLSTTPCTVVIGEGIDLDLDRLARPHVGELCLLVVGHDVDGVQRHDRHQLRPRLDILADPQRARADGAILGCRDAWHSPGSSAACCSTARACCSAACASASAVRSTSTCCRAFGERRLGALQVGRALQQQRLGAAAPAARCRRPCGAGRCSAADPAPRSRPRPRPRRPARPASVDQRLLKLKLGARLATLWPAAWRSATA